jgi:hypothetical protein
MMKIAVQLLINMTFAFLPLRVTEPLMMALNPSLRQRRRVAGYNPSGYRQIDWDEMERKQKTILLKTAREERRRTGTFNIKVNEPTAVAELGGKRAS